MTNLERLRASLNGTGAFLVNDTTNVQWLTGFTGTFGAVLLTPDSGVFVTDSRYAIQAEEQIKGLDVRIFGVPRRFTDVINEEATRLGLAQIAFEKSIPYSTWQDWTTQVGGVEWVPADDILRPLRMVKTSDEVGKIREAIKLAEACLGHSVRMLQPGVTEFDIGLDIEFFFRRNGAGIGFPPIVASGPNSARPHARPTDRALEKGDFVTIDLGCVLDGYCSDITRTFVIGPASDRHREVYEQVLKAEVACCAALIPGATGVAVDQLARDILNEKDLAKYFGHSLGHGLGRAVHDLGSLGARSTDIIEPGQVWTVEPGVYIESFGGVRIEDDVHVTPEGPEILSSYPKGLTEL